jgi:glucose-1-phosphate adenylyltransferase
MDYNKILWFHHRNHADATVAVSRVEPQETHKFGIVHRDRNYRISGWEEKPRHTNSRLASMGIYVFSKSFLIRVLEENDGADFGKHIIPYVLRRGHTLAFKYSGYWRDVGTPDAYWQSTMDLLNPEKKIGLPSWNIKSNPHFAMESKNERNEFVSSSAVISNSLIAENCRIEGRIFNSIIFPGVRIGKNVDIRNSIIMRNCIIASHARIGNTIMCENVCVGKGALIGCTDAAVRDPETHGRKENGLVLIGENMLIKPEEWVHKNAMVYKRKIIEQPHEQKPVKTRFENNFSDDGMLNFNTA